MSNFWTAEREKTLRRMWRDGKTSTVISKRLGTSVAAVCCKARRLKLPYRMDTKTGGTRATEARNRRVRKTVELARDGWSDNDIASELGVGLASVVAYRLSVGLYRHNTKTAATGELIPKPPETMTRECLRCGTEFRSAWKGNRVCRPCQNTPSWKSGNDFEVRV